MFPIPLTKEEFDEQVREVGRMVRSVQPATYTFRSSDHQVHQSSNPTVLMAGVPDAAVQREKSRS
jgi:hypothetical protein